jgi:aryl-alcohol dehydrogenase-like predicted oxidoreductase
MAAENLPMPLALGIGVMSDDPSDVSVQEEIVEEARQHNIKYLDTARHYVSGTCIPTTILFI